MTRQLKLGASIRGMGYHGSAWRHPSVDSAASEKIGHYIALAKLAESACFDMVFFADALAIRGTDNPPGSAARYSGDAELDPSTILPALAVVTQHIGLVATASTSYNEPYHIARRYASIDHISGGRAGWNVVTSFSEREAQNFNRTQQLSKAERYERANEFLEVVLGLWKGWDRDALIRDKASGIFFDPAKVHALDHSGTYFQVRGPLTSSRTPQGRPIIVQAGASDDGLNLAGRYADVVYTVPRDMESAVRARAELRDRARRFGRNPDSILVMPGLQIITGRSAGEARQKYQVLLDIVDPVMSLGTVNRQFGSKITPDMMDERVPEAGSDEPGYSVASESMRLAREQGLTVRELCRRVGLGQHTTFCGTPDEVTAHIAAWFEAGACDGFNILPSHSPDSLADIVEHIIPRLQNSGLFRRAYEGKTLRQNLGLGSDDCE